MTTPNTQRSGETYDKPDASVCKVWACPTAWAIAREVEGSSRWDMHGDDGSCWWVLVECPDKLPPGPWKPCYLVGQEPDSTPSEFEKELSDLINKHSKENGSNTPDWVLSSYLQGALEGFDSAVRARGIKMALDSVKDVVDPDPSPVTDAERAVLEALSQAPEMGLLSYSCGGEGWMDKVATAELKRRAARRPKRVDRPQMVAVRWADEDDVCWVTDFSKTAWRGHPGVFGDGIGWAALNVIKGVLPASEVEGGYSPEEQMLADEITKAMEASKP